MKRTTLAACSALALAFGAGLPAQAQSATTGKDLNGVWQAVNTANYNLEAHHGEAAMQLRDGPVTPVPTKNLLAFGAVGAVPPGESYVEGETLPYTPEAAAKRDENRANWAERDPEVKCYMTGVPRSTYLPHPFQIIQNDDQMIIVYEYANMVRNIFLTDPGEAPVDSWMGQSYGQWDGDTFVIEVTGQNGESWLDRAGNHYSAAARVTERYTRVDPYHIDYSATIEDPETFTEPTTISMTLYKLVGQDARIEDFNCVPFVEELMYGDLRKEPLQ